MNTPRLLSLLFPILAVASGCSSGGSTGSGGTTSATGTGTGTGTRTGTTATGTGTGTGTGGTGTSGATTSGTGTTSATGTGTGTTTSATTGTTTTTSTTGTGAGTGACTDADDTAKINALGQTALTNDVTNCGQTSLGAEPATKNCIKQMTNLSDPCVSCFDANVQCGVQHCLTQCIGGMSAGCTSCLHTNCTPAFNTCSGLMGP